MMKLLKAFALVGLGLFVLVTVIGFLLPSTVRIERQAMIDAPDHVVYAAVNTLSLWPRWTTWLREDSTAAIVFEGPPSGTGSLLRWQSNNDGNGSIRIAQATPSSSVTIELAMDRQTPSLSSIKIVDAGNGKSHVTWDLEIDFGGNVYGRWFGLFVDWIAGPDFERSLADLNGMLVSTKQRMSAIQNVTLPITHVLSARSSTATSAIGATLASSFARITRHALGRNLPIVGAPFVSYPDWNGRTTAVVAMLPVAMPDNGNGEVTGATRPAMQAVALDYYGPYELIGLARDALEQHLAARDIPVGESWEEYLTDPATAPDPATWHTRVYYALRALRETP